MKLHLPSGLRAALLACFAVFTGMGTTLTTATIVGGTFAVVIAAPSAYATDYVGGHNGGKQIFCSADGSTWESPYNTLAGDVITFGTEASGIAVKGWLPYSGGSPELTIKAKVVLAEGGGLTIDDGSDKTYTFSGAVSGVGTFRVASTSAYKHTFHFTGDMSAFTGNIVADSNSANRTIQFGNGATSSGTINAASIVAQDDKVTTIFDGSYDVTSTMDIAKLTVRNGTLRLLGKSAEGAPATVSASTVTALTLDKTATLEVTDTATLTLNGAVAMVNSITNEGTVTLGDSATLDLTKMAYSRNGSVYTATVFTGNGTHAEIDVDRVTLFGESRIINKIAQNGVVTFSIDGQKTLEWSGDSGTWSQDGGSWTEADATFAALDNANFTGTAAVALGSNVEAMDVSIAEGTTLTLTPGSYTLTAHQVTVDGNLVIREAVADGASKLVFSIVAVGEKGTVEYNINDTSSNDWHDIDPLHSAYSGDLILGGGRYKVTNSDQVWESISVKSDAQLGVSGTYSGKILISGKASYGTEPGAIKFYNNGNIAGELIVNADGACVSVWGNESGTISGLMTLNGTMEVHGGNSGGTLNITGGVIGTAGITVTNGTVKLQSDYSAGAITINGGNFQVGANKESTNACHVSSITVGAAGKFTLFHNVDESGKDGVFEYETGKFTDVNLSGQIFSENTTPNDPGSNLLASITRFGTLTVSGESALIDGNSNGRLRFAALTGSGRLTLDKFNNTSWGRYYIVIDTLQDFEGTLQVNNAPAVGGYTSHAYVNSAAQAAGKNATVTGKTESLATGNGFVKTGTGTLSLDNHTAQGAFTVQEGTVAVNTLALASGSVLTQSGGRLNIGTGGIVSPSSTTPAVAPTISLANGTLGAKGDWTSAFAVTIGENVVVDTTTQVANEDGSYADGTTGSTITLSGAVTLNSKLEVKGLGTLLISVPTASGITGYGGIEVSSGTLRLGALDVNSAGTLQTGDISLASGTRLQLSLKGGADAIFTSAEGTRATLTMTEATLHSYDANDEANGVRFGTLNLVQAEGAESNLNIIEYDFGSAVNFDKLTGTGQLEIYRGAGTHAARFDLVKDFNGSIGLKEGSTTTNMTLCINGANQSSSHAARVEMASTSTTAFEMNGEGGMYFANHTAANTFEVKSGTLTVEKLTLANNDADLTLSGGKMNVGGIEVSNGATPTITLSGGTLCSTAEELAITAATTLGNATIDTSWQIQEESAAEEAGAHLTFSGALTQAAEADTKVTGAGSLSLTQASTLAGTITKQGTGTLALQSGMEVGTLNLQGGVVQIIGTAAEGTPTRINTLTMDGGHLLFTADGNGALGSGPLTAGTYSGTLNIALSGNFASGEEGAGVTYTLLTLTGEQSTISQADLVDIDISGMERGLQLADARGTLSNDGKTLTVTITGKAGPGNIVWNTGAEGATWTVAKTGVKQWLSGETADHFYNEDNVTFSGTGEAITLEEHVSVGTMTVSGTGYSFSGVGSITADSLAVNNASVSFGHEIVVMADTLTTTGTSTLTFNDHSALQVAAVNVGDGKTLNLAFSSEATELSSLGAVTVEGTGTLGLGVNGNISGVLDSLKYTGNGTLAITGGTSTLDTAITKDENATVGVDLTIKNGATLTISTQQQLLKSTLVEKGGTLVLNKNNGSASMVYGSMTVKGHLISDGGDTFGYANPATGGFTGLTIDGGTWTISNGNMTLCNTPVTLDNGVIEIALTASGQRLDFFTNGTDTLTTKADAKGRSVIRYADGVTASLDSPDQSLCVRQKDLQLNVARRTTLQDSSEADLLIDVVVTAYGGGNATPGKLIKEGDGILEFSKGVVRSGINWHDTAALNIELNAGTLRLSNGAGLADGTLAIAAGATLEIATNYDMTGNDAVIKTLSGTGTILKKGTNAVSLNALSASWAGEISVQGGTLGVASGSALTMAENGKLTLAGGTGLTSDLTLNAGSKLALNVGSGVTAASLNTHALTLGEGLVGLELTGAPTAATEGMDDFILLSGVSSVTVNGTALAAEGVLAGSVFSGLMNGLGDGKLVLVDNVLKISYADYVDNWYWKPAADDTNVAWTSTSYDEWENRTTGNAEGKVVNFTMLGMEADGETTIAISGTVTPSAIVVNNDANTTYVFADGDADTTTGIAGATTSLTKDGEGTLRLELANTAGGMMTINGGIVQIGTANTAAEGQPSNAVAASWGGGYTLTGTSELSFVNVSGNKVAGDIVAEATSTVRVADGIELASVSGGNVITTGKVTILNPNGQWANSSTSSTEGAVKLTSVTNGTAEAAGTLALKNNMWVETLTNYGTLDFTNGDTKHAILIENVVTQGGNIIANTLNAQGGGTFDSVTLTINGTGGGGLVIGAGKTLTLKGNSSVARINDDGSESGDGTANIIVAGGKTQVTSGKWLNLESLALSSASRFEHNASLKVDSNITIHETAVGTLDANVQAGLKAEWCILVGSQGCAEDVGNMVVNGNVDAGAYIKVWGSAYVTGNLTATGTGGELGVDDHQVIFGRDSGVGGNMSVSYGQLTLGGTLQVEGALTLGATTVTDQKATIVLNVSPLPSQMPEEVDMSLKTLPQHGVIKSNSFTLNASELTFELKSGSDLTSLALNHGDTYVLLATNADDISGTSLVAGNNLFLKLTGQTEAVTGSIKVDTMFYDIAKVGGNIVLNVRAEGFEWTGDGDGTWNTGSEWEGGHVPGDADSNAVFMGRGESDVVTLEDTVSVGRVTVDTSAVGTNADYTQDAYTFTGEDATLKTGSVTISHGTLTLGVDTEVKADSDNSWTGTVVVGSDTHERDQQAGLVVASGAEVTMEKLTVSADLTPADAEPDSLVCGFVNKGETVVNSSLLAEDNHKQAIGIVNEGSLTMGAGSHVGAISGTAEHAGTVKVTGDNVTLGALTHTSSLIVENAGLGSADSPAAGVSVGSVTMSAAAGVEKLVLADKSIVTVEGVTNADVLSAQNGGNLMILPLTLDSTVVAVSGDTNVISGLASVDASAGQVAGGSILVEGSVSLTGTADTVSAYSGSSVEIVGTLSGAETIETKLAANAPADTVAAGITVGGAVTDVKSVSAESGAITLSGAVTMTGTSASVSASGDDSDVTIGGALTGATSISAADGALVTIASVTQAAQNPALAVTIDGVDGAPTADQTAVVIGSDLTVSSLDSSGILELMTQADPADPTSRVMHSLTLTNKTASGGSVLANRINLGSVEEAGNSFNDVCTGALTLNLTGINTTTALMSTTALTDLSNPSLRAAGSGISLTLTGLPSSILDADGEFLPDLEASSAAVAEALAWVEDNFAAGEDYLLVSSGSSFNNGFVTLAEHEMTSLQQLFALKNLYVTLATTANGMGGTDLVLRVFDDSEREWNSDDPNWAGQPEHNNGDVLYLGKRTDENDTLLVGTYDMLNTVQKVNLVDDYEFDLTDASITDSAATDENLGLTIRQLNGTDTTADLTLKGDADDLATLINKEASELAGGVIVDGMTVQVQSTAADGKLTVGSVALKNGGVLDTATQGGQLTTGALYGSNGTVGGMVSVNGTGGSYSGAYDQATINMVGGSQTLAPADGLTVAGTGGKALLDYSADDKVKDEMTAIRTTGADVELLNRTASGKVNTLELGSASSMEGGTLSFSVNAEEAYEGTAAAITKGAHLTLDGTDVVVKMRNPGNPTFDLSKGVEGRKLFTLADGVTMLNGAEIMVDDAGLDRYFRNLSVQEDGTVVVDLVTDYYSAQMDPEEASDNGSTGMQIIDYAVLEHNPLVNSADYKDLAGVITSLEDHLAAGEYAAADKLASAVAGSGVAALGMAISGDVERQLRAIRNRTTTMGVNQDVVNKHMPYFNAWMNAEGDHSEMDADGALAGFEMDSWGGTVGFDVDISPVFTCGLAVTAMYGDFTADAADTVEGDVDSYYVSAFARIADSGWVHTFVATAGMHSTSLERTVNYGGGSYKTEGDSDGFSFGAMYELGYTIALNEDATANWQPIVNVAYRHTGVDGYTETGSDAALAFGDQTMDVVTFGIGARAQAVVGENIYNRSSILEARVLAKFDSGDTESEMDSSLASSSMPGGSVRSAERDAFGVELGVGLTIPMELESSTFFIDGSFEFRGSCSNMNGTIGYRVNF